MLRTKLLIDYRKQLLHKRNRWRFEILQAMLSGKLLLPPASSFIWS